MRRDALVRLPLPASEDTTMSFHTLARPARRFVADRLGQLARRLEELGRRLREGVAHAVSQIVADGVRDAVRSALDARPEQAAGPARPPPPWDHDEGFLPPDDPGGEYDPDGFGWAPDPAPPPPPPLPP